MHPRAKLFLVSLGIVLFILFTFVGFSSKRTVQFQTEETTSTISKSALLTSTPTSMVQQVDITSYPTRVPTQVSTDTVFCSNEKRGGLWTCPNGFYCDNLPVKFDCVQGAPCAIQYNGTCRPYRPD